VEVLPHRAREIGEPDGLEPHVGVVKVLDRRLDENQFHAAKCISETASPDPPAGCRWTAFYPVQDDDGRRSVLGCLNRRPRRRRSVRIPATPERLVDGDQTGDDDGLALHQTILPVRPRSWPKGRTSSPHPDGEENDGEERDQSGQEVEAHARPRARSVEVLVGEIL